MAVNVSKTKYIIFRPKGASININLNTDGITYNSNELDDIQDPTNITKLGRIHNEHPDIKEQTYKFLGIYLDEYLSFDTHINHIHSKIAQSHFIINRAKNILPKHCLKTLYFSLIHPHLLYCLPIYSCTSQKNITKLFTMQKKAIRTITKSPYRAHTEQLFTSLGILPLNHLITYMK